MFFLAALLFCVMPNEYADQSLTNKTSSLDLNKLLYKGPELQRYKPTLMEAEELMGIGSFYPAFGEDYFGYEPRGRWFMAKVSAFCENKTFFLTLDNYFLDRVEIFILKDNSFISKKIGGTHPAYKDNSHGFANYTFPIAIEQGEYIFLICVSGIQTFLPLELTDTKTYLHSEIKSKTSGAFILGCLLGILLINFFLLLQIKDGITFTILKVLVPLFGIIYAVSRMGIISAFFWPDNLFLIDRFNILILCLMNILSLTLLGHAVDPTRKQSGVRKTLIIQQMFLLAGAAAILVLQDERLIFGIQGIRSFIILSIIIQMLVLTLNQRYKTRNFRLWFFCWVLEAIFYSVGLLKSMGVLPYRHFTAFFLSSIIIHSVGNLIITGIKFKEISIAKRTAEKELQEATLRLLQNRNRPHFLMNTFNLISGLIRQDSLKAEIAVNLLAGDFNYFTNKAMLPLVLLEEEMHFIKNYLKIMGMRFSGRLNYEIQEKIENRYMKIPPLTLQPLVENAIKYCDPDNNRMRNIDIQIYSSLSTFSFFIRNPVLIGETAAPGETHKNIISRLQYHYVHSSLSLSIEKQLYEARITINLIEKPVLKN